MKIIVNLNMCNVQLFVKSSLTHVQKTYVHTPNKNLLPTVERKEWKEAI